MKTNIFLLGLNRKLIQSVAYKLSLCLDMFYADVNDLLQYEVSDIAQVIDLCGISYVEKLESKKVKSVARFDNTIFTMSFPTFNANKEEKSIKEKSLVVFLDLPQAQCEEQDKTPLHTLDNIVYKDRRKICQQYSDIVVRCIRMEEQHLVKSILQAIKKSYGKGK